MSVAKAKISRLTQGKPSDTVDVLFNPKELTFSKTNNWKQNDSPKADTPAIEFTGGGAVSLKVQLYFDTYQAKEDVREVYLNKIYQLTRVDPKLKNKKSNKGRPPEVRFQWGKSIFDGVISSINQRLTLFLPTDGTPVRAVVDLTLTQAKDDEFFPKQNPTSGGAGGDRVWVVREGDTLPWIAYSEYNDATEWRVIAEANRLTRVRALVPGTVLVIPGA